MFKKPTALDTLEERTLAWRFQTKELLICRPRYLVKVFDLHSSISSVSVCRNEHRLSFHGIKG